MGTDPDNEDTDGDGLSDGQEVEGFSFANQMWYTDPNEVSTLKDTIPDGQKCQLNTNTDQFDCDIDKDGDGTPDVLDRDFDGDGVPNHIDLSPYSPSPNDNTTFGEDNPVSLIIDGLQPNKPTYVEFQLRPNTVDHLSQALNVLDWPDDGVGQIQRDPNNKDANGRRTDTSFYDICILEGRTDCRMSPDANGDIRLVPMLEIRTPGTNSNLPSEEELDTYGGIALRKLDNSGAQVAYVPLQLVNEPNTDAKVAFYGKMLYRPNSTWGGAHQVRLV